MRFRVETTADLTSVSADAVVWGLTEEEARAGGGSADGALGPLVQGICAAGLFHGELGETDVVPGDGAVAARAVILAGLGPKERLTPLIARRAAGFAARRARAKRLRKVAAVPLGADLLGRREALTGTIIGLANGGYRFTRYKSEETEEALEEVVVLASAEEEAPVRRAVAIAEGVLQARAFVDLPPNAKFPEDFARDIVARAKAEGIEAEMLDRGALEAIQAGGILAVGQGSDHPPAVVILRYRGGGGGMKLGYLGKGMTFDSGGLSLKTAAGMETMKSDMAGAAAVVAALLTCARLGLPVDLVGVVMLAENMTGGSAQRPGDVLRMLSGKTVEMLNSDAEGRLILADGVTLLRREGVDAIIDLATLTGACVTALGDVRAGLIGNDDGWLAKVEAAAARATERVWRMPADDDYRDLLKSHIADLKNVGGPRAGMQTGGLFIGAFAEGVPWAHLDIAGTAYQAEDKPPFGVGGTGFGVETLVCLAEDAAG